MLVAQKTMNGYFSVFDPNDKKIADCGALRDAIFLVGSRNKTWDGHYYQFKPVYETVNVDSEKYLSSTDIVVNMDGGVGGSWTVKDEPDHVVINEQKIYLQQSNLKQLAID